MNDYLLYLTLTLYLQKKKKKREKESSFVHKLYPNKSTKFSVILYKLMKINYEMEPNKYKCIFPDNLLFTGTSPALYYILNW
jgi:hypothetical protein